MAVISPKHAQRVTIEWDGQQWIVGDEGGEFARTSDVDFALRYAADLMYGPPTYLVSPEVG